MKKQQLFQIILISSSILLTLSIFGDWMSYESNWSYNNETHNIHGRTQVEVSPIKTEYEIYQISVSFIDESGIERRTPDYKKIDEGVRYFYDPFASIIGVFCVIGGVISSISYYYKKYATTIIFGLLCTLSVLSFFITLPRNIDFLYLNVENYWYVALFSSLIILMINILKSELRIPL